MSCVFCANPEIQKRIVAKDEYSMAFPSNMPLVPGHVIVCPVRHIETVYEITHDEFMSMINMASRLKAALGRAFSASGFNYAWNEGKSAGQAVSHFHLHIVPRKEGDAAIYGYDPRQFFYRPESREIKPEEELQIIAKTIRELL